MKAGTALAAAAEDLQFQVLLGQAFPLGIAHLQVQAAIGIIGLAGEQHAMAQRFAAEVGRRCHQLGQVGVHPGQLIGPTRPQEIGIGPLHASAAARHPPPTPPCWPSGRHRAGVV